MDEFKIDIASMNAFISGIKKANENFNTSARGIDYPSKCKGIKVTDYVDRIYRISQLLDSYKALLEKDAVDLVMSRNIAIQMDTFLKTLYKNGGPNMK